MVAVRIIFLPWWLRTSSNLSGKSQVNIRKIRKWTSPKRVRIRPKYSATVTLSRQEDKDLFVCSSFVLLSGGSDGGAIF